MAINVKKLAQLGMEVITDTFQSDVPQDQHAKAGMKLISDALQPEIQEQWWYKNPWVTWVTSFDDNQQKKKISYYIDERTGKKYYNPEKIPRPCWMN